MNDQPKLKDSRTELAAIFSVWQSDIRLVGYTGHSSHGQRWVASIASVTNFVPTHG